MSELSKEQLQQLTDAVNERFAEFDPGKFAAFPPGVVRIMTDVIRRWYQEKEESWAMQRISDVTIAAEMAMKLSKQGYDVGYAAANAEIQPTRPEGSRESEDKRHSAEPERKTETTLTGQA